MILPLKCLLTLMIQIEKSMSSWWFTLVYIEKFASTPSSSDNIGSYLISTVEDEYLNNTGFILSAYLSTITKPKKVILVGTIITICYDKIWYYNACNHCKSGVEETFVTVDKKDGSSGLEDKKTVMCTNADCKEVDIVSFPRFKIVIRVHDSYGTITLTLFDFEAYKIFKKLQKNWCKCKMRSWLLVVSPNYILIVFDILIGQKLAFIITVSKFNIKYQVENYGISMLTLDPDIVSALYAKFKIHEYEKSDSSSVQPFEIQSIPCDVSKVYFL
ncbi:putative nucleic acid-binding protein [Helianthus debilis subsp. tardiflorus]